MSVLAFGSAALTVLSFVVVTGSLVGLGVHRLIEALHRKGSRRSIRA